MKQFNEVGRSSLLNHSFGIIAETGGGGGGEKGGKGWSAEPVGPLPTWIFEGLVNHFGSFSPSKRRNGVQVGARYKPFRLRKKALSVASPG